MNPVEALLQAVRAKGLKLGFAESCTGGLLAGALARVPGVSDVLRGSVVSYANEAKMDLLRVPEALLVKDGAVSESVARAMARGACAALRADCVVAVTGIAGPSGGTALKPVGTVWFAAVGPGFEAASMQLFAGDRAQIQNQAVDFAMDFLTQQLLKK